MKQAMGFLLLAVVIFLLQSLPYSRMVWVLAFLLVLAFGTWIWGCVVTYDTPTARRWIGRGIAVVIVILAGWWMLPVGPAEEIPWQPFSHRALQDARSEGRIVLVDFTSNWCLNCKTVEAVVFKNRKVIDAILGKKVLPLEADWTHGDPIITKFLRNELNEPGVPLTAVWLPEREKPVKLPGIYSPSALINVLEGGTRSEE
jgi:thiol:disulfide interchange protein DsbD